MAAPSRYAPCPECGDVRQINGHHRDALCRKCRTQEVRLDAPDVLTNGQWVLTGLIRRWRPGLGSTGVARDMGAPVDSEYPHPHGLTYDTTVQVNGAPRRFVSPINHPGLSGGSLTLKPTSVYQKGA